MLLERQPMDPDATLIERTLEGDLTAFEALVERHRAVVYRVAARIVGPHDADDVSQDTFLRAFHRLGQYRGTASFRTWLLQITQNTALNALDWKLRRARGPRRRARAARSGSQTPAGVRTGAAGALGAAGAQARCAAAGIPEPGGAPRSGGSELRRDRRGPGDAPGQCQGPAPPGARRA